MIQILDNSVLTSGNFDYDFSQDGDGVVLIVCKHNELYYFSANSRFQISCAPSEVFDKQETNLNNIEQVLDELKKWVERVERNLEADAELYGDIDDFVKESETFIEGLLDAKLPIPENEQESWVEKLSTLEQECIRILEQQKKGAEAIEQLRKDIDNLKAKIGSMPAGTWLRSAAGRFRKIYQKAKNNPQAKAFMLWGAEKGVEKLLGM